MNKYELTENTKITPEGVTLHQIRALRDIPRYYVEKGEYGGWVSGPYNLSQVGDCWITEHAHVWDNARVSGDAHVWGVARISGNADISDQAQVADQAQIGGHALVTGQALIGREAKVDEYAFVGGQAWVTDKAYIGGNAHLNRRVQVHGNVRLLGNITTNAHVLLQGEGEYTSSGDYRVIGPLGKNRRYITLTRPDRQITAGCFHGTLDEFKAAVTEKYGEGPSDYHDVFAYIETYFNS
jgi:hypothetical protein